MKSKRQRPAPAWLKQGADGLRAGRLVEAEAVVRAGLAGEPGNADGLHLLGVVNYQLQRFDAAVDLLHRAVAANGKVAAWHNNYGMALQAGGRLEEAVASYRRAIGLQADHSGAFNNMGAALRGLGRHDEAEEALRSALALVPDYAEAHNNLANLLAARERFEEAVASFRHALRLRPGFIDAHHNLAEVLATLGRLAEALAVYDDALVRQPQNATLHRDRSLLLFLQGELEQGWREHEWRFGAGTGTVRRRFPQPAWDGQDLRGARILVWMEQGIGDELLFAGLLPELIERAAGCVVECAPKLLPLFARSFPGARVVARADPPDPATTAGIDFQVAAGSLGRWFRPTLESFPLRRGYLRADPARVAHWRERLAGLGPGMKLGFAWRSGNLAGQRALACTRIEQWGPVFGVDGIHFVSLQYDDCAAELARARAQFGVPLNVYPEVDLFNDLDQAAALTSAMDLVIGAPTSATILAGALGVATWQMTYGPDWKTFGSGTDPWHPSITRIERRPGETWESIFEQLARKLASACQERP